MISGKIEMNNTEYIEYFEEDVKIKLKIRQKEIWGVIFVLCMKKSSIPVINVIIKQEQKEI